MWQTVDYRYKAKIEKWKFVLFSSITSWIRILGMLLIAGVDFRFTGIACLVQWLEDYLWLGGLDNQRYLRKICHSWTFRTSTCRELSRNPNHS